MANLEDMPLEIREHIANYLPSMDVFVAAEASPKMEEVQKIHVVSGTDFQIDFTKNTLIVSLHEMSCWSATFQALGEMENGN